jgi:O-methyltransferase
MVSTATTSLLARYPLISDQIRADELRVLLRELEAVLKGGVEGELVELGCYEGTAALFFQRLLNEYKSDKVLHVYDSFAGLPAKAIQDNSGVGEQFREGELLASKQNLIKNFKHAGLRVPVIHKGWFSDLTPGDLPDKLAFAFLDGDFYDSILDSLKVVWPKLAEGAVVLVDDYQTEALPGVRKALDVWAQNHQFSLKVESSLAVIRPA